MTSRIHIDAQADYMLRIAHRDDPVRAVIELVWNSLDAEAGTVRIDVEQDGLDGVSRVVVADDGHGVAPEEIEAQFGRLGGSWKQTAKRSPNIRRQLNGRNGQGRIRGFALGDRIRWITTAYNTPRLLKRTIISGNANDPTNFEHSAQPTVRGDEPGTLFEALDPPKYINRLCSDSAQPQLTATFSVFLTENPHVTITFNGIKLDPKAAERHRVEKILAEFKDGEGRVPILRIIEWYAPAERAIHLCDTNGTIRTTLQPDIQTPGLDYTAFVLWDHFSDLSDEDIAAGELSGDISDLMTAVRIEIKRYFKSRDQQRRAEQVALWKLDGDYPYGAEPADEVERVERETFDYVATTIARKLPHQKMGRRSTLALLKTTVSSQPSETVRVLEEVMNLPRHEIRQLAGLLDRTQIAQLIAANTKLTNRLDFLRALKEMVFDPETSKTTKERSQLHKILERHTWVFGEEYDLMASDKSLDTVLERHLGHVRDEPALNLEPVRDQDGAVRIIDLMLGQARPAVNRQDYLVVELKRPGTITLKEVDQIKRYADAVTGDPQFRGPRTHWDFLLVSTKIDRVTSKDLRSEPLGVLSDWTDQDPPARIWVKTWAQIIDEREKQLRFFKDALNYDASRQHAIDYINSSIAEDQTPATMRKKNAVAIPSEIEDCT